MRNYLSRVSYLAIGSSRVRLWALLSVAASIAFAACGDDDATTTIPDVDASLPDATQLADTSTPETSMPDTGSDTGIDAGPDAASDGATDGALDADANDAAVVVAPASCKAILAASSNAQSGIYVIDPDGAGPVVEQPAYCDMVFDGGGWTLLFSNTANHSLGAPGDAGSDAAADAGYYLRPPAPGELGAFKGEFAQKLAQISTQVHIRTPFAADAGPDGGNSEWITSRVASDGGVTLPMLNLRNLELLNAHGDGGFGTEWSGPNANATRLNYANTGVNCSGLDSTLYPSLYWACDNTQGLHFTSGMIRWIWVDLGTANEPMEAYVR